MTGKEKKIVKQRVFAKEKLRQFYSSYKFHIDDSIKFIDTEIRVRLSEIENFFSLNEDYKHRASKKRRFDVPFSRFTYLNFKNLSRQLSYLWNKELRRGLKEVRMIHQRQSFRNVEIFKMMQKQLVNYIHSFEHNYHLSDLCGISNKIGEHAKRFKKHRIIESKTLFKECKELIRLCKKDMLINNIDEYIKTYTDFFVQCQFRLDKFVEQVNMILFEQQKEIGHKDQEVKKKKKEELSLELPGWSMASKFE